MVEARLCRQDSLAPLSVHTCVQVYAQLKTRRGLLEGVVFSGGEPSLQPGLADGLAQCRALGLQTKLDTNGTCPETLGTLLNAGLLDYVAMGIKAPWVDYQRLAGVAADVTALQESVQRITASGVAHQFRTTYADHAGKYQGQQGITLPQV